MYAFTYPWYMWIMKQKENACGSDVDHVFAEIIHVHDPLQQIK